MPGLRGNEVRVSRGNVRVLEPSASWGDGSAAAAGADALVRGDVRAGQRQQDHRAVKRIVHPMLGFKNFRCARALIAGIETVHMIKKGQLDAIKDRASSAANQFYSLAF